MKIKTRHIYPLILFFMAFLNNMLAQNNPKGVFDGHQDIGAVKHKGDVSYHDHDQEYLIAGSGANMWFGDDQFQGFGVG